MQLIIGQKVAYPNQGVCLVEEFREQVFGTRTMSGYSLRVLNDNSTIFVPEHSADTIGLRPLISSAQCKKLIERLSEDFEPVTGDWKSRSREFTEKLRTGDVFQAADVMKMLTYLSKEKKLSFREQTLLEKSKFLIISEIANTCPKRNAPAESDIVNLVEAACQRHAQNEPRTMSAAIH